MMGADDDVDDENVCLLQTKQSPSSSPINVYRLEPAITIANSGRRILILG